MPVVMVNWFDWLVSVPAVAVTRTGVLTTPALTVMTTSPLLSDTAVGAVAGGMAAGVRVIPPIVVLKPKETVFPLNELPPPSITLNVTCEVSVPPMPFNEMMGCETEMNCKEPMAGALTAKVPVEEPPEAVAVTVSVPAQPLSR
jgi:hypothetical protein